MDAMYYEYEEATPYTYYDDTEEVLRLIYFRTNSTWTKNTTQLI